MPIDLYAKDSLPEVARHSGFPQIRPEDQSMGRPNAPKTRLNTDKCSCLSQVRPVQ